MPREREPFQPRFQTYLQFDLGSFLEEWTNRDSGPFTDSDRLLDEFQTFFLLFGQRGFVETDGRLPMIERAVKGSSEYRLGVSDKLKERAFEALRLTIEGFLRFPGNSLDSGTDLEECRRHAFILLYRLLFILYAEDRQLLPYRLNSLYTENRSLGRFRDDVAWYLDRTNDDDETGRSTAEHYEHLLALFDLVDRGHKRYDVPAYNGGLFDNHDNPFLEEKRISNWHIARVIDKLGRTYEEESPEAGLVRVDFRDLTIQHLGAIYEGLLELHPKVATRRMSVVKRRIRGRLVEKVIPFDSLPPKGFQATDLQYSKGDIYLETHKGERRASGSYYTPDHIVNHIVEQTLGPICKKISDDLMAEIDALETGNGGGSGCSKLSALESSYPDRVLQLRVLDPAMGSGHFLIGACQYLAEEISTHPCSSVDGLSATDDAETTLTYWKRLVVERCLFGVDINPLAVELAKLALWLETVSISQPLTFLDHHLRVGNSLIGGATNKLGVLPNEAPLFADKFEQQVANKVSIITSPLVEIEAIPSDTAKDLKEKRSLLTKLDRSRRPFIQVADLWCSYFSSSPASRITSAQYQDAVRLIDKPTKFKRLAESDWFRNHLPSPGRWDSQFFHWEFEFPEVFLAPRPGDMRVGFNAIIGNPPYDVLSEKETGHNLTALISFVDYEQAYKPSKYGKNNLYKLFLCQANRLIAEGGRLGFIVPMSLLGDKQAVGLRKMLADRGTFDAIETFPQKDNPKKRVFPDAKLSTTIVFYTHGKSSGSERKVFRARRHPAQFIMEESPGLSLSARDMFLYDPENLTIVACHQASWDMAIEMMDSGRLCRLADCCVSHQGEVNETTDRGKGFISDDPRAGPQVLRGSNVSMYLLRAASQGEPLFLLKELFLSMKSRGARVQHTRELRLGYQRSAPQNTFRRIISALIPPDKFCFDTISYIPKSESRLPLYFLLGLLNCKLIDWYFRLGSSNSKVNDYQFKNLPCPIFRKTQTERETRLADRISVVLGSGNTKKARDLLFPEIGKTPYSPIIANVIAQTAKLIEKSERIRGAVTRADRSRLGQDSQHFQDFLDDTFFLLAGLSETESEVLERHLGAML